MSKTPVKKNTKLDKLVEQLLDLKAAESAVKEDRIKCEEMITAIVGAKDEGSTTTNTGNYTVITTQNIRRTLDTDEYFKTMDKMESIHGKVPDECIIAKVKYELDSPKFKKLIKAKPKMAKVFSGCVTSKPQKVGVKIK